MQRFFGTYKSHSIFHHLPLQLNCTPKVRKLLGCYMYRHHNFKERLNIVSRLQSGEPLEPLCKELKLDNKMVRFWYLQRILKVLLPYQMNEARDWKDVTSYKVCQERAL